MKFLAKNSFIVTFVIIFLGSILLDKLFHVDNFLVRLLILIPLGMFLSPRRKKVKTQSGEKTQVTWIFLKEPIFLD